jgi:hypothetical protein
MTSLTDQLLALTRRTFEDPAAAARELLRMGVPLPARTAALLLVAVLSALLSSLQVWDGTALSDPISTFMLGSPFRTALLQWGFLALSVLLIHRVGRAFGGRGSLQDALLIFVWLQTLMLGFQVIQLLLTPILPGLAGLIALAGFAVYLWLLTVFIAELHGFSSRGMVFLGMVLTGLAAGFVLAVLMILIFGPEAFLNV